MKPDVKILHMVEGAKAATGITVIIDVFRAFSVEAYLIAQGVEKLYPVGDMEIAYEAKRRDPGVILVGERKGVKLPGFDYGNCPSEFEGADFTGKTVYHTTSAGTQGVANAVHAREILTGSLVNARAIADYVLSTGEKDVSLVPMGLRAITQTEEDNLCAYYLKSILEGDPMSPAVLAAEIEDLKRTSGAKFFDPAQKDVFPTHDFELCTAVDRFDFVLRVEKEADGRARTVKVTR